MFVDRIQRHDVLNAVALSAVLLVGGLAIAFGTRSLLHTAQDGMVSSVKAAPTTTTAPKGAAAPAQTTTSLPPARPPAQVKVRVANGARRLGVGGAGTEVLKKAGYPTLPPKNGPTMADSIVYYTTGYAAEAAGVAVALGLEANKIAPLPGDPGVPVDDANVVVILGTNSNY